MVKHKKEGLKILDISRVFSAKNGSEYRAITVKDLQNAKTVELPIYKESNKRIWNDFIKKDNGEQLPIYPGYITTLHRLDIVVFGWWSEEEAFNLQKFKIKEKSITCEEAQKRLGKEYCGFQTDLSGPGSGGHDRNPVPPEAKKIRFRVLTNNHREFIYSPWYEIKNN